MLDNSSDDVVKQAQHIAHIINHAEGRYEYYDPIYSVLCMISGDINIRFGIFCVSRALPLFSIVRPDDTRPRLALEAAINYFLLGSESIEIVRSISRNACIAGHELDDHSILQNTNPAAIPAINAADAASNLALAVYNQLTIDAGIADPVITDVASCIAYAVEYSADTFINDVKAEQLLQIDYLIQLLSAT